MKKICSIMSLLLLTICLFSCTNTPTQTNQEKIKLLEGKKILIAYYSYSGNTKNIAQQIQNIVGGDIIEIETTTPYSNDYDTVVKQAKQEKKDNYKPAIKDINVDITSYDIIFIGSPVWWYTFASPIRTFLSQNDFSNKIIIPFCTHGGGGASETYNDIQSLQPNATVLKGFSVYGAGTNKTFTDIQNWIKSLSLKK